MRAGALISGIVWSLILSAFSSASEVDLSHPPEPSAISALARSGGLISFRNDLGRALSAVWKPAQPGRRGSSSQESFARWVDLYQWLDLIGADEASVTKRWLSHHLSSEEDKSAVGKHVQVGIHPPGTPLVRRYDALQHQVTEEIAGNGEMLHKVMVELVAQPFSPENGPLASRLDPAFVAETASDPIFLNIWGGSFSEDDFAPKVLLNLQAIWKANRSDWQEFLKLAIAIAVVQDQPAPSFWPHQQVNKKDVPRSVSSPAEDFARWVKAFREGRLRMDPRLLDVRDLKFVVDAPVEPSELDWVRNSPSVSRLDPARAFSSITYDKGRVAKDVYDWPWGPYTLSRIREHGGICVDQAYYASLSGKALGIPTIFFAGQGKDGGHAWIGFLKHPGDWNLDVGRYEDQNLATGMALDPQNWTPINDHDIELLTRHLGNRDPQDAARRDLVMAWDFRRMGDANGEGRALESALAECPENPAIWDAREDWLVRTGARVSDIKAYHEAAIRQFSRFRDLKTQHEEALVRLAMVAGDKNTADHLSEQIIHENRGGRNDLSAAAAGQLISSEIGANNPEGALQEYERQLRLQGTGGGGDFFYKVTVPLSSLFITKKRPDLARRVLKEAFDTLKPVRDSLVDKDFRRLWKEAGGIP